MLNQTAFDLLRKVLRESLGLPLQYFDSPDADLTKLDLGIRAQMQEADQLYAQLRQVAEKLEFGKILLMQDSFRQTTVLLRAAPDTAAFYSIGPFRWMAPDADDFLRYQEKGGLTQVQSDTMNYLFRRVPVNISNVTGISIAKNLLLFAYGLVDPPVQELDLEPSVSLPTPQEDIADRARRIADIYQHEEKLLAYIAQGNEDKALEESHFFVHSGMDQRLKNRVLSNRSLCYTANSLFCRAAHSVGVHPLYCDEISERFARRLELCTTSQQILEINDQMVREYCALCRQYTTQGYSPNIQKVMQYIQIHLSQELTPDTIAQGVSFSPGYISRLFKEETGSSLGAYIAARRVEVACRLLERSTMTVREIASYVGIPDWNYFTKVFRKEKGCTPSQYRKKAAGVTA